MALQIIPQGRNFGSSFPKKPPPNPSQKPRQVLKKISQNCLKLRGFWLQPKSTPQGSLEPPEIPHFPQISSSAVATNPKKLLFSPKMHSGQAKALEMLSWGSFLMRKKMNLGLFPSHFCGFFPEFGAFFPKFHGGCFHCAFWVDPPGFSASRGSFFFGFFLWAIKSEKRR